MNHGQASSDEGMLGGDGHGGETAVADSLGKAGRAGELADGLLDGDLPDGGSAYVDVRFVVEAGLDVVIERRVVGQPPEDDMSVEQEAQGVIPKSSAIASLTSSESQSEV